MNMHYICPRACKGKRRPRLENALHRSYILWDWEGWIGLTFVSLCMFNSVVKKKNPWRVVFLKTLWFFVFVFYGQYLRTYVCDLLRSILYKFGWIIPAHRAVEVIPNASCKSQLATSPSSIVCKRNHFLKGHNNYFRNSIPFSLDSSCCIIYPSVHRDSKARNIKMCLALFAILVLYFGHFYDIKKTYVVIS